MSTSRPSRRAVLQASAAACLYPSAALAQTITEPKISSLSVTARPIEAFQASDRGRVRFGDLLFRGGVALTSSFPDFGGLSAIRLRPDGEHFVMLNDNGLWFTGRIVYRGKTLVGVADVASAPMLDSDGHLLRDKRLTEPRGRWFDTEALAIDGDTYYVGLERVHQIVKFNFGRDGFRARGEAIAVPPAFRTFTPNRSIEGMVLVPKGLPLAGTLIVLVERALDRAGNLTAFLLLGTNQGSFSIRRTDAYDISDAAILPSGELLLLERKFSLRGGAGIRIRRIPLSRIAPGALVDGPTLFEADLGYEIDNFEGLDVHQTADGDTVLTLVSDDNFSFLQRTILMQFTLVE